jgi:hypothetical protein
MYFPGFICGFLSPVPSIWAITRENNVNNDDAINVFHADAKQALTQSVYEMYFPGFICGFLSPVPSIWAITRENNVNNDDAINVFHADAKTSLAQRVLVIE